MQEIEVVTDDGSPAGKKDFLIWLPPLKDEIQPDLGRMRALTEAVALFGVLLTRGVRTIVFCKVGAYLLLCSTSLGTDPKRVATRYVGHVN